MEIYKFILAICMGITLGFIYTIYESIRCLFKFNKIITGLGDFTFWIMTSYLLFRGLIKINSGEIRGYIVLGFILGIIIYYKIFKNIISLFKKAGDYDRTSKK